MASTRQSYIAVRKETTRGVAVKPTKFLRYKEGDVMYSQEVIANSPIQNNRWAAINSVKGKVEANGSYKIDIDPSEFVFWLAAAL